MDELDATGDFHQGVPAGLERRLYAALIDMVIVSAGCFAVLQADSVLLPVIDRQAGGPAAILLAIIFASEALTGRSVGKIVMRLRVESLGAGDGGRATILQTAVRAGTRWFAPLVSLASVLTKDMTSASILLAGAMIVVICEVPVCYISLFRRGGTVFDLIARTRIRPA